MPKNILLEQHVDEIERLRCHQLAVLIDGGNRTHPETCHTQKSGIVGIPEHD